jgi:hypothetical protein
VTSKSLVPIFKIFTGSLVRPQSHGIIRLVLYVIMYFIFYFSIGYGTAFAAYHMFAIDVIGEFRHVHLVHAFVLKQRKPMPEIGQVGE